MLAENKFVPRFCQHNLSLKLVYKNGDTADIWTKTAKKAGFSKKRGRIFAF